MTLGCVYNLTYKLGYGVFNSGSLRLEKIKTKYKIVTPRYRSKVKYDTTSEV